MGTSEDITMEIVTGAAPEEMARGYISVGIVIGLAGGNTLRLQAQDADPDEIVAVLDMVSSAMKKGYHLDE